MACDHWMNLTVLAISTAALSQALIAMLQHHSQCTDKHEYSLLYNESTSNQFFNPRVLLVTTKTDTLNCDFLQYLPDFYHYVQWKNLLQRFLGGLINDAVNYWDHITVVTDGAQTGETIYSEKNLSKHHFVSHKSHIKLPGIIPVVTGQKLIEKNLSQILRLIDLVHSHDLCDFLVYTLYTVQVIQWKSKHVHLVVMVQQNVNPAPSRPVITEPNTQLEYLQFCEQPQIACLNNGIS